MKKWGAVEYGAMAWQDPSTWMTYDNRQYTVSNFKGLNHTSVCPKCTEFIDIGAGYPGYKIDTIENVRSFTECKDLCTKHAQCKAWTLSRSDEKCRLKSKKELVERKKGLESKKRISGTEACYGFTSQTSDEDGIEKIPYSL